LNIATDIAVCNFNDGLITVLQIMKVLEMEIGLQSYNFCLQFDAKRIKHAERSLTDAMECTLEHNIIEEKMKKIRIWKGSFMVMGLQINGKKFETVELFILSSL